jgi:hypothetical protein
VPGVSAILVLLFGLELGDDPAQLDDHQTFEGLTAFGGHLLDLLVQVVGELDVQPAHNVGHYETSPFHQ